MASEKLQEIVSLLEDQGEVRKVSSATEDEVSSYENAHDRELPSALREWLMFSDGGEFFPPAGLQLYGVAHKPMIDADDGDRPSDDYLVIGRLAYGDPILCRKGSDMVTIYNHEAGTIEEDESYPDLFAFLEDLPSVLGIKG